MAPALTSIAPTSGPVAGLNSVTLTGTGFVNITAVRFGGTPASYTVDSGNQITATAPPGSGTVQVTVVATPGGTSNGLPYTYIPVPSLSGIGPDRGPTTGGTSVTLTGTGLTGATAVTFGATPATSFTVVSDTQITATAPAGSGTAQVTVTTPGGLSNGVSYTYVLFPVITSIDPTAGPTAGSNTVTLTGSGFVNVTAVRFGTVAAAFEVDSGNQITVIAPPGSGTVQVTVTTIAGVSNGVPYTYVTAPVLTSLDPTTGPEAGGTTVVLTGTGLAGATAVSFGGTPATSFTVVSDSQIIAIAPAGVGVEQVTVTTIGGTSNGLPYTYAVIPAISAADPDEGPVVGGTSVVLTGTGFTGATAVEFGGTPATFIVVSDTQIIATAPAGTGTVQVTVTTPGGTSNGVPFTYVVAPVLIALDPTAGPETGGTVVTLTGTGFTGASAVSFGGTPATSFTVVSDTEITATAPAGTGVESVTVTTVGGTSNGVPFTYVAAPVLTSLDPTSGPETGGTPVILTGTGFTGASAVSFGGTPATFIVVSDTQIIATAPAGTGVESVTVTTVGGISNGVPFTYVAAPVLIALDPTSGPETGGTVVTLTGTGFTGASAVSFGGIPAASFTVVSDTEITATAPAGIGVESVTVTTVGGVSNGLPFTYVAAPVLIALDPTAGPETGGTPVTLTGTGFTGATAVDFGGTPATSFTVVSDTEITATAPAGTGVESVTVTTVGGVSNGLPFTYVEAPVLTSLDPSSGPETGGTLVILTGTGFTGASAVSFGGTPATSFTVLSDTQIIATAPAGTGVESVTVTTVGGTSNGVPFTYVAAPVLTALDPTSGPETGGTTVTLTGTGFTGASAVSFGGIPAASFTVVSDTEITATAPAGTGVESVTVTTVGGTSNGVPFTYVAAPLLIALDPTAGPETGGTVVTLTGTNFTGASAVSFGGTPAASFTVVSDTEITATAPAGTGVEQVTVTTVGGTSNGAPFTYVVAPALTALDPTAGPETGGTTVTLTGTGLTGATAVSFGGTPATSFIVVSDTQITAIAPAGTGTVQVTATTVGGTSGGVSYTYVAVPSVSGISPDEGPETGGTTVTVTGSGFTGASAVSFGATPATSFTVVSDSQITATAPAGIGVQQVTVTTVGGTSNGAPFTYVVAPVLIALDPTSGPESGGTTVTLTGVGFTGATAVSFGGTPATSFTVVSDTEITATAPAGTGVEQVTVTTVGGTSGGVPFTYVAAPALTSLDPTAGPETGGTTVTLTGTGFTGATAVDFGATPATFMVVSDTQIAAIAPAGTGVQQVTVTTVGGTSGGVPYTYVAVPSISGIDPDEGPTTGGTTVTVTGSGFTGATAVTFGGTPATSFTVVSDTQITATAPAGTGVELVTVTTVGGVSNGAPFTYVVAPVLIALDPTAGPEAGGTTVTLTGTGFTGATAVDFGGTPATSFTVVSDTEITAIAPAGTGIESVTVTTVGGVSNGVPFVYVAAPALAVLAPTVGPETGGTTVTLTGTGFAGATAVDFGATPATSFTVVSDTQITATAPAGTGVELVTVTTVGGTSNGLPFAYVAAPALASLAPPTGPETGGTTVTLTGTGFTGATAVDFGATPAISFTVDSDTQITAIAPAGTGVQQVTVTTVGGTSNGSPFTYVAVPVLAVLAPAVGPETGGTTVTLTGTGFTGASAVSFGGTPATSFTVVSDTEITATAPAGTGVEQVTVTTVGGTSNGVPFTYVAAAVLALLAPIAGPETGGTTVTLTGTGFAGATAVSFGATPATSFTVDSDTQITAIAPAGTGVEQVTVTTVGGTSNGVPFTYVAAAVLALLAPIAGPETGGTVVTLTGSGFTGATAVDFGATPATSFTVVSDTEITAIAPAGTGVESVTVTTVGGTSSGVPFTYVVAPVLALLDPIAGPEAGGTTVTLTGTGFTGASAVTFGATPATAFTVDSDTQITATAPAGTGIELVVVTTAGGASIGLPYSYIALPTIGGVSPVVGSTIGGDTVTIIGTGLSTTQSVTFDGAIAPFAVVSDLQITATAPAGVAGPADVVVTTTGGSATAIGAFTYVAPPEI